MQRRNGIYVDDEPAPQGGSVAPALVYPLLALFLAWGAVALVSRAPSSAAVWCGAVPPVGVGLLPLVSSVANSSHSVARRLFLVVVGVASSALGGVFYFALVAVASRGLGEAMP
jgi:hypothetical protein